MSETNPSAEVKVSPEAPIVLSQYDVQVAMNLANTLYQARMGEKQGMLNSNAVAETIYRAADVAISAGHNPSDTNKGLLFVVAAEAAGASSDPAHVEGLIEQVRQTGFLTVENTDIFAYTARLATQNRQMNIPEMQVAHSMQGVIEATQLTNSNSREIGNYSENLALALTALGVGATAASDYAPFTAPFQHDLQSRVV